MNSIEEILVKENPLWDAKKVEGTIQKKWEKILDKINEEFESKSDHFLREKRVKAIEVAKLSKLMLG